MKRFRIWINSFTLIQQFLAVVLLSIVCFVFFITAFLNRNIDIFVNNQMHGYIHREQNEFLESRIIDNDNSNVIHYVYNVKTNKYLNTISDQHKKIINSINPNPYNGKIDSSVIEDDNILVYSIISFDEDYRLVSIIKNDYRNEFRDALINSVVNITFYILGGMIVLILLWVVSLIRPLNLIKNYINKIRNGEKAELNITRNDEIGEVADALTTMNKELAQQKHIRDEMIQNISHDLKTPIATIKSYSESIKDGIYPYETLEKSVDVISENADRLEKKVYSLITYNKLEYLTDSNDNLLNLKIAPIIHKTILDCKVLRNEITIKQKIDENVYFHGEEDSWRVVFENLLDNSLRYAKNEVNITLKDNLLEVFNDGEAIEKDRLDKLFKPYEKGTKGKFGLGLSIVRRICETYGYSVTGENMSNGVVFRIYSNKKFKKLPKKKTKKV